MKEIALWLCRWCVSIGLTCSKVWAMEPVDGLQTAALQCGAKQSIAHFQETPDTAANNLEASAPTLTPLPPGAKLELVIYYEENKLAIPEGCNKALFTLSAQVKKGQKGVLLIRPSVYSGSSAEYDLAIASERMGAIKAFLRQDKLAIYAMLLELRPFVSRLLPGESTLKPQLVKIYSSPVN